MTDETLESNVPLPNLRRHDVPEPGQLTIEITLAEYRELIVSNMLLEERCHDLQRELDGANGELGRYVMKESMRKRGKGGNDE